MRYFAYIKPYDNVRALKIHDVVWGLERYAKAIYKSYYADVLDEAYFHILNNFNEDLGYDLENYATKIVKTIGLNRYSHEIANDLSLEIESNKVSYIEDNGNPSSDLVDSEPENLNLGMEECIKYLTPRFIKDFKLFQRQRAEYRTCDYSGMFRMFSTETITKSIDYLKEKYGDVMEGLMQKKQKSRYKSFPEDRYIKSLDPNIEYLGVLQNRLLYRSNTKKTTRFFYNVDIRKNIDAILECIYSHADMYVVVEGIKVYCSLSGQITSSIDELREILEREIVGTLLARLVNVHVVVYDKGVNLILTVTKELLEPSMINFFGREFCISITRVATKRVS